LCDRARFRLVAHSEWVSAGSRSRSRAASTAKCEIDGIRLHRAWPPEISFERLRIGNPRWATTPNLVDADRLAARVEIPPLFTRSRAADRAGAPRGAGSSSTATGRTWQFGDGRKRPTRVGRFESFVLGDGHIVYRNKAEAPTSRSM
jgi:hypothetical protein